MHATDSTALMTPDRELERRVVNYLWGRHVPGLRRLAVSASDGTVTIRGNVRSFYEKQLGHHCCRRVAGVVKLIDRVNVDLPGQNTAVA